MILLKNEDPRVQRTKRAFEEALLSLLNEEEFDKITVSALAEAANLNRATFYLHYTDKEDLLESYLTKSIEELKRNAIIPQAEFSFDASKPHPLFVRVFEYLENNYKFFKIMLARDEDSPILYSVIDIIESFVDSSNEKMIQRGVGFEVEINLSKTFFTHAFLGSMIWWLKNDMPYSPKHMALQLTKLSTVGPYKENPFIKFMEQKNHTTDYGQQSS